MTRFVNNNGSFRNLDFCTSEFHIPYSGNFLRTINFTVFVDFTATSKINPQKSYYSIQME